MAELPVDLALGATSTAQQIDTSKKKRPGADVDAPAAPEVVVAEAWSDAAPAVVVQRPVLLYAAFLGMAATLVGLLSLSEVFVLAGGYPEGERAAGSASSTAWRVVQWALVINAPRIVMILSLFQFTYVFDTRELLRLSVALGIAWAVLYAFDSVPRPGSESASAAILAALSWAFTGPVFWFPLWLVGSFPKRAPASTRKAMAKPVCLAIIALASVCGAASTWVSGALAVMIPIGLMLGRYALYKDPPAVVFCNGWYVLMLEMIILGTPLVVSALAEILVDNFDQTDAAEALATALSLAAVLFLFHRMQHAASRRALPGWHSAVALFPLHVFEDCYYEFFFVSARVFSAGYFALVLFQVFRTIGRDTGAFSELWRATRNLWRRFRGLEPAQRDPDFAFRRVRLWLQSMLSELSAMFVFVGVIGGEELRGQDVGPLTGLSHGRRMELLGGYMVILVFELCAHAVCYAILRKVVVGAQSERTIRFEAGHLIKQHGLFLLSTLLTVTALTLAYVRALRIEYDD